MRDKELNGNILILFDTFSTLIILFITTTDFLNILKSKGRKLAGHMCVPRHNFMQWPTSKIYNLYKNHESRQYGPLKHVNQNLFLCRYTLL